MQKIMFDLFIKDVYLKKKTNKQFYKTQLYQPPLSVR